VSSPVEKKLELRLSSTSGAFGCDVQISDDFGLKGVLRTCVRLIETLYVRGRECRVSKPSGMRGYDDSQDRKFAERGVSNFIVSENQVLAQ
jgi:hypothetical protein